MPAIITNGFRKYNADNFINSLKATSASPAGLGNKMYLMIGKADSWATSAGTYGGPEIGQYADGTYSDTIIPTPTDTTVAPFIHHNDMIAAKLINSSDVSHVVKRTNWTSGTVYHEYDHSRDDLIDRTFFVMNANYNVYKCIDNNGGLASTVEPSGQGNAITGPGLDGYRWKFMYEVQQADVLKYVTTDWIPIKYLPTDDDTKQWDVQQAAIDGELEHIAVSNGGTGYITGDGVAQATGNTTTAINLAQSETAVNDTFIGSSVYIKSGLGNGQLRLITDYVNSGTDRLLTVTPAWDANKTPDATSNYEVRPTVTVTATDQGSGGTAGTVRCGTVTAGIVKSIVADGGTLYRGATATLTTTGGVGQGSGCVLTPRIGPKGGHGSNAIKELGGAYVMINVRLEGTEDGKFDVGDDFRKVVLIANPIDASTGLVATGTAYDGVGTGSADNELKEDTGDIIYVEYRAPITRASDQTEDVKLVVEF